MSVVYLADDLRLKRKVALKVLARGRDTDAVFRARFLRESELAASLDHASVIPIYEAGEAGGLLFIAMRYVNGSDLGRLLLDGPLEPRRAIELGEQIAAALDAAHDSGLVHADVKPSNVLIDAAGHAYLADFGLTTRLQDRTAPQHGLQGTVDYIAPEQIEGKEADGRADAYSLGCLLHECLTGAPPFHDDSDVATLFGHLHAPPPNTPGAGDALARALAKDPADRYASCSEMVEAARHALGLNSRSRRRWPFALGTTGLALIAALALILTQGGSHAGAARDGLVRLHAGTGKVVERLSAGEQLTGVSATHAATWASDSDGQALIRVQRDSKRAESLAAQGAPYAVAAGRRYVVTANGENGTVAVFDATSGRLHTVIHISGNGLQAVCDVAIQDTDGWATDCLARRIVEFDALSGRPLHRIRIEPRIDDESTIDRLFAGVAVGRRAIWVAGDALDPTLYRIDRASRLVVARIPVPAGTIAVAVGEGSVWLANQLTDSVIRVDPGSNRVIGRIAVGREPLSIAVGAGFVWTANALDGTVSRIDPSSPAPAETFPVGGSPVSISVDASDVWVATSRR
jgi:Protein kinase domain